MFGMGFTEIFLIAVVAIIALGPEKLPGVMVDIAKMFKKIKSQVSDAKSTIDDELKLSEMKKEADKYRGLLDESTQEFKTSTFAFDDVEKEIAKFPKKRYQKEDKESSDV